VTITLSQYVGKSFYKFWCDEKLQILKEASIDADKLWKSIGKPRRGPIFDRRQSTRLPYRKRLRHSQTASAEINTNDLHEALMRKNGPTFWKCCRSKFESTNKCVEVDGCVDPNTIADKFAIFLIVFRVTVRKRQSHSR